MNLAGGADAASSFFHPLLWQKLGTLIVRGYEGHFETKGDRLVPTDVASYRQALGDLGKIGSEAVLDSVAWINMRPLFSQPEREELRKATSTKKYAFDHVEDVLKEYYPIDTSSITHGASPSGQRNIKIMAVYAARANPTKWQPWTKPNHRRVMKPGVWIGKKVPTPKSTAGMAPAQAAELRASHAKQYWESRKRVGLLLGNWRMAYFFEDDDEADDMPEPDEIVPEQHGCLNTHLGKAGGLNFGLHAVSMLMAEAYEPPPSLANPLFYAIIDARHSSDQRLWLSVLPPFFFADEHSNVTFQSEIALVQLAHNYLGLEHSNDYLDMRNDFLFTGMAVIRNQAYGMTSCGTGGVWAVTHTDNLEDYFFGRTMIEDTASSINEFLKGRKAMYVAPFASRPGQDQLMCAVPKVSETYLEALERWDTGAIQCLCALALGRPWFWISFPIALLVMATIAVPSWYPLGDIAHVTSWAEFFALFDGPEEYPGQFWLLADGSFNIDLIILLLAAFLWLALFVAAFCLTRYSPRKLNFVLRMCVLYFNVTYPLNSIASVFWIAIPPWICIGGKFPFRFNPVFAILGSLMLRIIEWAIVLIAKKEAQRVGSHLHEFSIFRSQQMNEVTVPIKLRACVLGFISGFKDVYLHHDNSFWISFGQAEAVVWVQAWLCLCMLAMAGAFIGGIVNLCLFWNTRQHDVVLAACSFGMVLAAIQVWILFEPTWYVMKGRKLKVSLRHTEVFVLLAIGVFVVVITQGQLDTFKAFKT